MDSQQANEIDAWIDVGGTFTDCYVRLPGEQVRRCKILSSGRTPLSLAHTNSSQRFLAAELRDDVEGFWVGSQLVTLDHRGHEVERRPVIAFQSGYLELTESLTPDTQVRFELDAGCEAPVLGVHRLLGIGLQEPLPGLRLRLGTTKGTNALLTRTGTPTVLAVTAPFADLLVIGDQTRSDLFALSPTKTKPLTDCTIEIPERLAASGEVLQPLRIEATRDELERVYEQGYRSLAICLLHSHINPAHEQLVAQLARQVGFEDISISTELAPLVEVVARAQTAVVDAYLSPIIRGYLQQLITQFSSVQNPTQELDLQVMTSAGGLVEWRAYSGKDSILSGPAGGVAALAAIAEAHQCEQMIGLDMGGTSTDVCRVAGQHDVQYESAKAGVRILTPTLPIETVASGGGSICWFDGVSLRVGPQSAGALPGPACYGRGGPLTVTDLNVFLGLIPPEQFPFELDLPALEDRIRTFAEEIRPTLGAIELRELCRGLRRIATEQMAEAVRTVTIRQGADPRDHVLLGFGGAAGQHICEIAEALGIERVLDSTEAGLLSALGMGVAPSRRDAVLPVYRGLDACDWPHLRKLSAARAQELAAQLKKSGADPTKMTAQHWCELRYRGTDATLTVPFHDEHHVPEQAADGREIRSQPAEDRTSSRIATAFHREHQKKYGYARDDGQLELVAIRTECMAPGRFRMPQAAPPGQTQPARMSNPAGLPVVERAALDLGDQVTGPAIVLNEGSTLVVGLGWEARAFSDGVLELRRKSVNAHQRQDSSEIEASEQVDPVFRECYAARLSAIATQMGAVLQNTAASVNVKRRRDFSCAVFDARGNLLANAPHVPVHLGAMGRTVREVMSQFPEMRDGDCVITNDPYAGGSHLPDVTVITPVLGDQTSNKPHMFVANRAHHADIGGISPGSMSVEATTLGQEGVLIEPMKLIDGGRNRFRELRHVLETATYPPRNVDENLADVAAQVAANQRGLELLADFALGESWPKLTAYAEHLLDAADRRVKQFIEQMHVSQTRFADQLDDGSPIVVSIRKLQKDHLQLDFAGSAKVSPTNFNANPSITRAAVMYVLRCLIGDDVPMNEGVLRSIDILTPPGILNPPRTQADPSASPAVAAGNVETSQRVVDVLLASLGVAAASQGTMNNLLFGNSSFGFYETICGGAGATAHNAGASAIHTHMTNTRLTDPEVLESNYPVRLHQFRIRSGSGGTGIHRGGDGVCRELEFLQPVSVSLLSSRRGAHRPFGLSGGSAGLAGRNTLLRQGASSPQVLPGCCALDVEPGDRLRIETPGGGGFGDAGTTKHGPSA